MNGFKDSKLNIPYINLFFLNIKLDIIIIFIYYIMTSSKLYKTNYGVFQISNKTFNDSKDLLKNKPIGTFILRTSSNSDKFTLDIIYADNKITHIILDSVDDLISKINNGKGVIDIKGDDNIYYKVKLISSFIDGKFQYFSYSDPSSPDIIASASAPILAFTSLEEINTQSGGYKKYLKYKQKCMNINKMLINQ